MRNLWSLAAPDSANIQIRTVLGARSHKATVARSLIDPILDVQTDWRWQKLKIIIDPTGRMAAAYGKQRQFHTFAKAKKTGTCRHVEILATMAVHGAWQLFRTRSEADKKAFKRLQSKLQAIFPLSGDPFRKEGALFELGLIVKAKKLIHIQTRTRSPKCWDGAPTPFDFCGGLRKKRSRAAESWSLDDVGPRNMSQGRPSPTVSSGWAM